METRTIPELLQVLLDNEKIFIGGLCPMVVTLCVLEKISIAEMVMLRHFFIRNLPCKKYYAPNHDVPLFCFPCGQWTPRKEWLEKQIEYSKNFEE